MVASAASTMRAGFTLVATKEYDEFRKTLVGETWELDPQPREEAA